MSPLRNAWLQVTRGRAGGVVMAAVISLFLLALDEWPGTKAGKQGSAFADTYEENSLGFFFIYIRVLMIKISRFWCLGRHQPPQVTETAKFWHLTFMALSQKPNSGWWREQLCVLNVSSHFTSIWSVQLWTPIKQDQAWQVLSSPFANVFFWPIISSAFNLEELTETPSYLCAVISVRGAEA